MLSHIPSSINKQSMLFLQLWWTTSTKNTMSQSELSSRKLFNRLSQCMIKLKLIYCRLLPNPIILLTWGIFGEYSKAYVRLISKMWPLLKHYSSYGSIKIWEFSMIDSPLNKIALISKICWFHISAISVSIKIRSSMSTEFSSLISQATDRLMSSHIFKLMICRDWWARWINSNKITTMTLVHLYCWVLATTWNLWCSWTLLSILLGLLVLSDSRKVMHWYWESAAQVDKA